MKRLNEIRKRLEAATPGYEIGRIEERDNWCINVPCPPSDSGLKKWPVCEFYGGVTDPKEDAKFIANAPTDIRDLLAALEVAIEGIEKITKLKTTTLIDEFECKLKKLEILADIYEILDGGEVADK